MPIIIKHNDATELCITNGEQAKVVGWTSIFGHHYQLMLDMLFVELENPATVVQLENLPLNVVPVSIICA